MIRLMNMNAVFLAVTVAVAFINYHVKYSAQHKAQALAKIERKIAQEDEQIKVLEAEWSYLNEPQRLQKLAERNLDLGRITADQVVLEGDLPARFHAVEAKILGHEKTRPAVVAAAARLTDDR